MKHAFRFLAVLGAGLIGTPGVGGTRCDLPIASQAVAGTQNNETRESRKADGTIMTWTRDASHPRLGQAWRDESGTIWGDAVKNRDGGPCILPHSRARDYCKSIGAELPSLADFTRLRESMGADPKTELGYFPAGYVPQVLPNLGERGTYFTFWSSTVKGFFSMFRPPTNRIGKYSFSGYNGAIGLENNANYLIRNYVRCVVRPR